MAIKKTKAAKAKAAQPTAPKSGVVQTVVDLVQAATSENPISKDEILAALVKQFPERKPESMKASVDTLVPGDLRRVKALDVQTIGERAARRFYVNGAQ